MIHPDILQSLKSYVNSENFLVSSLFCLFESAQIASSFEVIDATGKKITDSSSMFGWLMATTHYFTNLSKDDEAKNPFILGYGVTQKLKKHLSSQAEFAPTDYHFSTTGGVGLSSCYSFSSKDASSVVFRANSARRKSQLSTSSC